MMQMTDELLLQRIVVEISLLCMRSTTCNSERKRLFNLGSAASKAPLLHGFEGLRELIMTAATTRGLLT
eukprot:1141849-Pelagomonas_calceolata.AAC.3